MRNLLELQELDWRGSIMRFKFKWLAVVYILGFIFFISNHSYAQENKEQDSQDLMNIFDDIIYNDAKNNNKKNGGEKGRNKKKDDQDLFNVFDEALNETDPADTTGNKTLLKIYVDGSRIDPAYMRKQIPYVNFVRDPNLSDVQILVTSIGTASGGREYRLNYIGRKDFSRINFELEHSSFQDETDHIRRERLIEVIKMGLIPYISQTSSRNQLKLDYDMQGKTIAEIADDQEDPWNYWVIELSGRGSYYKEESYNSFNMRGSIEADKITENWKFTNSLSMSDWRSKYINDNGELLVTNSYKSFRSGLVKSLSRHWSSGLSGSVYNSTYTNIDFAYSIAPAIEYNIFPWEEVDRREFTIAYRIGLRDNTYIEETIYGQTQEMLSYHSMVINLRMIQKWGDIRVTLTGSQYFHDIDFYSAQISTSFDVRLTKNLSFFLNLRVESIHDQLYLPAGEATPEEIITRQRSLATTYEYSLGGGFRFRFGSIYNNIINRRL